MLLHLNARSVTMLSLAFAMAPVLANAQKSTSRGLSVGLQALGTSLTVENGDENNGGGLGLRVGYGFNRIVTGFITLDGSAVKIPASNSFVAGEWTLAHAEIGARFHFANSLRRWVPYLETAIGGRSVSIKDVTVNNTSTGDVSFNGPALSVGTGLSVFASPKWAFDAGLRWTGGKFTEVDLGNAALQNLDIEAASFRLGVGVVWWP
jgi:Outer membrane protein beta-barrel domain